MNEAQFHQLADQLMQTVEEKIDNYPGDKDIDYQTQGNVMTISFDNGSAIIINRQEPFCQIWLASKDNGYHFNYQDGKWLCSRSGQLFEQVLDQAILKHLTI